tara:strand:+ start:1176 stop:1559 length:384 start_codon:yes stop_codon:yes gene_type:complete
MGRYYHGDIEGKFGFAIQQSNDADFFGVIGVEQNSPLTYEFEKDDLNNVNEGIKKCKEENLMVKHLNKYNEITKNSSYINHEETASQLGIDEDTFWDFLKINARLHLGLKIKQSIETIGQCHFEAEL